jgi:hypothetical protein
LESASFPTLEGDDAKGGGGGADHKGGPRAGNVVLDGAAAVLFEPDAQEKGELRREKRERKNKGVEKENRR